MDLDGREPFLVQMSSNPALTVIVVADNYRERTQRLLRGLLDQDVADQIRVMVFDRADDAKPDLPEFGDPKVFYEAVNKTLTLGQLQKNATLTTTTEIIAFIEEHVTVPPGWARESLRLHAQGYTGVTGSFDAGNPRHRTARVIFSITYGSYLLPSGAGETTQMPGDNSSFIRSKLLKYEDDLEVLFNNDTLLMWRLIGDGEKLYRANFKLKHWNEDRFWDGWIALFWWNQMYICNRVALEKWGMLHRVARFLATPLAACVRSFKSYRQARRNGLEMKQFFADLPLLFLYHTGSVLGIATGLLLGPQQSEIKFTECETRARRAD